MGVKQEIVIVNRVRGSLKNEGGQRPTLPFGRLMMVSESNHQRTDQPQPEAGPQPED